MRGWLPHRWLRGLGLAALGIGVVVLAVFAWALLSTGSSTFARALVWMEADVEDRDRFPARAIPAGDLARPLPAGPEVRLRAPDLDGDGRGGSLDDLLAETDTSAFVVVHRDRVVYERYLGEADRGTLQTSFSVAKPFVSALVGIAIGEGSITDVDDPVTDYLPELAERDPRFEQVTLRHLLTMSSGLRYEEGGGPWPSGDDTYTYYGSDLREVALERSEVDLPPGREWHYNNYNPLLLGLVIERATGMPVAEFASRRLWGPLGAADDATWSLDSEESGFEKMESGVNATARDYARFGLLFLDGGRWGGERAVPETWVRASTSAQVASDYDNPYGYFWWVDGERPRSFYGSGNYGQYVYVAPQADAVVVRTGAEYGIESSEWLDVFRTITDQRE